VTRTLTNSRSSVTVIITESDCHLELLSEFVLLLVIDPVFSVRILQLGEMQQQQQEEE